MNTKKLIKGLYFHLSEHRPETPEMDPDGQKIDGSFFYPEYAPENNGTLWAEQVVQTEFKKYRGGRVDARPQRPPHSSDFARLARRICGKSIGVVLGGGGARGISHLVLAACPNKQSRLMLMLNVRAYCGLWRSTEFP